MKTIACRDTGFPCDFIANGRTIGEIYRKMIVHNSKEHGAYLLSLKTFMTPKGMKKIIRVFIKEK